MHAGKVLRLPNGWGMVRADYIAGIVWETAAEGGRILLVRGGSIPIQPQHVHPTQEAWIWWLESRPSRIRAVTHDGLEVVMLEEHNDRSDDRWRRALDLLWRYGVGT